MKRKEKVNYWSFPKSSLDFGSSLEKVIATNFGFLPWRIPWTEEPGRGSHGSDTELDMTEMN